MNKKSLPRKVRYEGAVYQVVRYFCNDPSLYMLRSNFERTSSFVVRVADCEVVE